MHGVLTVCDYKDDNSLAVIEIESIRAVIGMVPFGQWSEGQYFLAEKLGLDVYEPDASGSEDSSDEAE